MCGPSAQGKIGKRTKKDLDLITPARVRVRVMGFGSLNRGNVFRLTKSTA